MLSMLTMASMPSITQGRQCSASYHLVRWSVALFLACATLCVGCTRDYEAETTLLERAEANFTAGEYEVAERLYRHFLRAHPRSPYAAIASQRLRIVDRELEAVMGHRGTLTPVHVPQRMSEDMQRVTTKDNKRDVK